MRILLVNKFHYIVGGSETYYFALKKLLETHGHDVIEFSMQDDRNIESKYSKYFIKNVDYKNAKGFRKIQIGLNIVYSIEAKKRFEQMVIDIKPDLVHLNIFQHQISESILDVIKKYKIPTVYTAHELKMICPNYKMYCHGEICERCKGGRYYQCTLNRCIKDSFSKSFLCSIEAYVHMVRRSYEVIGKIITPSKFYYNKFREFGVEPTRLSYISNFLEKDMPEIRIQEDYEKYYLYFGRLSAEKGIGTLIRAAVQTGIVLYILGSGEQESCIRTYINEHNADNIKLLGFKKGDELASIVGNAKAVILPSEWYENGPYTAIEALQLGRPIIGSDMGGIPELITNNGFVFRSKSVDSLVMALNEFEKLNTDQRELMKENSRNIFKEYYTPESHYNRLIEVYNELIKQK